MKIAIYSRGIENDQHKDIETFMEELKTYNVEPVFFQDFFNQFYSAVNMRGKYGTFNAAEDLDDSYDFMISLGGDGTLLDTVTLIQDKGIPVLGINYGRLGFLATIGKEDLGSAIKALVDRTYVLDERTLIHLDADLPLFGNAPFCLNEFVIHKKDTSSMIKIHTYLNGEFLNTYWADGLIVATPTGSTGYSLSCNGPVVFPESGNFVITPVAPHNLNIRPIVVSDDNIISFEVESRSDGFLCSLDSRRELVPKEVQLAVKKEEFSINLVRLNENNFLQTLRNKLSWGLDKRN
ncbi:NAD kinase [Ferruginibacter paludis]|uniref:NAD kinase n=1 Tax=Ferruginibacter TaxID=1004303 RepID=UPI0025B51B98|nr:MULTISPECIES: NAD kinase [Ferruginibacter]MDB5280448.1 kinase [Ferruginibacter sp.]MDN3658414.1 NAD kinase [Ferruginibacter paludis]